MPRPAAKRNDLTTRTLATSRQPQSHESSQDNVGSRDISRSPRSDAVGSSRLANSADPSDVIRQLRNQTPLGKAHEFAIGSSPGTEQGATGSRPPTRARGYSSTLSIAGRKGDTSSRIPGTPAFESSVLSNFRRRPRQASVLHMMQDEDGSSEWDDDDFLGGLSPEDESTPLNISRGKSLALRPAASSERSPSSPTSGGSSKRKRSAKEAEVPQSPLEIASSAPGSPTPQMSTRQREVSVTSPRPSQSPIAFSATMEPPMSSPVPALTYEMSTPDSDSRWSRTTKKSQESKAAQPRDSKLHIPTAALQDKLLPRRRQKRKARRDASRFEVHSESEEDDLPSALPGDDELSYIPTQKRSQTQRRPACKPQLAQKNRREAELKSDGSDLRTMKQYGTSSRKETNIGKENEPAEFSSPLSSALDSDELESVLSLDQEASVKTYLSEELRLQALKFAEVDRWQMEFEDVITVNAQENGAFR